MKSNISGSELEEVVNQFGYQANNYQAVPLGNGLINHTFFIEDDRKNMVLQRLNHNVFPQPQQVIENAELISQHLCSQKENNNYPLTPIWQLNANNGDIAVQQGEYTWRALHYQPNCYTIEAISTTTQASQAATAFAQFTAALSNFDAKKLNTIIPDFHNIHFRLNQLNQAIVSDQADRLTTCQPWIKYCLAQQGFIDQVGKLTTKLPLHVTHNDTKINNLLFCSKLHRPLAVIDLDTCMPGYLMHDFGDMVRTCCSNLTEDSTDLKQMEIRLDIFHALLNAYTDTFKDQITPLERKSLLIGAQLLPLMIGMRFLTDYLNGDNYFHINYPEHNLDRAANQFTLHKLLNRSISKLNI